jgi:hypothetical protein
MGKSKNIRIDFYRVALPDGQPTFKDLLQTVFSKPAKQRNFKVRERTLRLQSLYNWGGCQEGELVRIRIDDIPSIADLSGGLSELQLQADQGVGERAVFVYDERIRILAIERNLHGASAGAFAGYFEAAMKIQDEIVLEPVLRPSEFAKIKSMTHPRKFMVNIAKFSDNTLCNTSTWDFVKSAKSRGAQSIRVELISGRKRDSGLNIAAILDDARNLFSLSREDDSAITKLKVSGRGAADEILALDLLSGRLKVTKAIDITGQPCIPYEVRRDVVREAYSNQQHHLRKMFED